jgi:hypothetical protein
MRWKQDLWPILKAGGMALLIPPVVVFVLVIAFVAFKWTTSGGTPGAP